MKTESKLLDCRGCAEKEKRIAALEAERDKAVQASAEWANSAEQMMKAAQTSAARVKLLEDELRKLYGD